MQYSYLCNLITGNKNWRDILEEKNICIKEKDNLAIFNYDINADFSDPVVQESRGIIIDLDTITPVCFPFRKFGNSHEYYADKIDWASAKVQEKVDGSIIKLWFYEDKWRFSSNSCIDAKDARLSSGITLDSLIKIAENYKDIDFDCLNKNYTYIFELVSPLNQIVIFYDKPMLYHIGTRDITTGKELDTDIGIIKPKEYPLHSLEACIEAAKVLNKGKDYPDNEGFVVVDKYYNRVKIKSPEYLIYHHAIGGKSLSKAKAWKILNMDDFDFLNFVESVPPHVAEAMNYYFEQYGRNTSIAKITAITARSLSRQGCTRKQIAEALKDGPLKFMGFKALDHSDLTIAELLKKFNDKIWNLIPKYEYSVDIEKEEEKEEELER